MLRHVVYKRNEKDFATKVVEDDATGAVTAYVDDKPVVTAEVNELTGGITKIWSGSQAEYDAIAVKADDTLYVIV